MRWWEDEAHKGERNEFIETLRRKLTAKLRTKGPTVDRRDRDGEEEAERRSWGR